MRVVIQHRSRYIYPRPARLGPHLIRLRPADHARATIERYQLAIEPEHRLHWLRDPHGNRVARVTFKAGQATTALDLLVELAVDIRPVNPFDFLIDDRVKQLPFRYPDELDAELAPYLETGDPAYRMGRRATDLLGQIPSTGDTMGMLVGINSVVRDRVAYVIRDEPGIWTPEQTLENGRGSCRDAAVLLVALMRARGIAARFVSGYLVQLTDEGMIPDEPRGVGRDVVDLHAWAEAYVPGAGWIGFDGTSGLLCGEGHIPLAAAASPQHAAPLDGTSDVGASEVEFSTHIARLGHETRPTAPYTDDVWAELATAGDRADQTLTDAGLEVWIGGEPTFTARTAGGDQARPEWQGDALGADKWQRGRRLAGELRDRLAPGGLILHRMGKHYPGESLPRWALDIISRRGDGPPLWPDRDLAALPGANTRAAGSASSASGTGAAGEASGSAVREAPSTASATSSAGAPVESVNTATAAPGLGSPVASPSSSAGSPAALGAPPKQAAVLSGSAPSPASGSGVELQAPVAPTAEPTTASATSSAGSLGTLAASAGPAPATAAPAGTAAIAAAAAPRLASDRSQIDAARRFGEALADALGISAEGLQPAFEDPWEILRAEAALPADVDPRSAGLDDPEERRRLARIFDRGAGSVVGWVLPLTRDSAGWRTERWKLRREHLFLLFGDSPVGLRLPLGSIIGAPAPQWADAPDLPDPRRGDSADASDAEQAHRQAAAAAATAPPRQTAPDVVSGIRTALAIEPRDGDLWLYLPPVARFADFCALIAAIDRAREVTGLAVELEGYGPPPSPERIRFAVTPDPGVLEVNLPPVTSCSEAITLHHAVFDAALASGLTAERYMLDGRAAGSGGGNHITIGGPSPERSPWLRRPALLASLVTFAQHHPSLSYLFTGLFVGPTSQAPRVDEARHDALYELEIALPRLFEPQRSGPVSPGPLPAWEIDALLRHLLVDVAGSTHRAEISIDKLFDPLTPYGRQGLVELRAFEMPPHPRMLAAQAILVRAMLAAFVAEPYRHPLVRWGQELHDRFLLPYFLWHDFEDVLAHLAAKGIALPVDGYRPFIELRCPLAGALELGPARLEIRNAIEPWHVLGEEASQHGTARYVDSSVERIELRAIGLDPERYAVAVNQAIVPLRPVSGRDVRVGGVRFRAWCPPHALHPHLGIHHPLRIDIVDTWGKRGVAGAAYHVWHPEGQAFDAPPLTRVEAEARRLRRFTIEGPSPWPLRLRPTDPHPEQPYTLDLRRIDAGAAMPRAEDWSDS